MNVSHESIDLTSAFMVLSAELGAFDAADNATRTSGLRYLLDKSGVDYAEAKGMYKGSAEASFIVQLVKGEGIGSDVVKLTKQYGQESVLFCAEGASWLLYLDESAPKGIVPEWLGEVRELYGAEAGDVALQHDAYTAFGNRTFIVE